MGKGFTRDQLAIAKKTNLYDFLITYHPDCMRVVKDSLRPTFNNSISIKQGYNGYKDFGSTNESGNSVDFLVKYWGYDLVDAVLALCNGISIVDCGSIKTSEERIISNQKQIPVFPKAVEGQYKKLFAYLSSRGISTSKQIDFKGLKVTT